MEKISAHISYSEATKSQTATRKGIKNVPTPFELGNMRMVAEACFEPLRQYHGKPIHVSSFFRCEELNRAIGGSGTSQHLQGGVTGIEEGAIDIDADHYNNGITNLEIFEWLRNNADFDQIINEYPNGAGNPSWVHISYRKGKNRRQALKAVRVNGKTKYEAI